LTSKSALEGERKQVTVLFADLKGSMELLAERDPEEARSLLDPVLHHMMEAVHHYEGTVNQVMGDGIMALFGAPLAHEDHALRACYAALRMQDAVRRHSAGLAADDAVDIRIGLNSGDVLVRAIGSDLHMDYTAVGQTTHLAARMEQLARPGSIVLTASTLMLAEGYVDARPLGKLDVKGLAQLVDAWELRGATGARSRLQARAAYGLTKFVARTAEMNQLVAALERARSGHGQVVGVVGEPGVGKSRLFREFLTSRGAGDYLALESVSASHGSSSPWMPVTELLKSYFKVDSGDDDRKISEKVAGKILLLDPELESLLPPLLWLFDIRADDADWSRLDGLQRRYVTLEAVKRLLLHASRVQPLVLVFEDLQWIDSETQAFLDSLVVESLPAARILLLVNYRPQYGHDWVGQTYYHQIQIDPLPASSAEELLAPLLGDDQELVPLRRRLIAWTEGNPFFLEESVRTLVETKVLVGDRGAYRLAQPVETIQVPPSVASLLAARIDRLAPTDKQLLQAAAVIGHVVPYTLLSSIADLPEPELRGSLTRLQAGEFLHQARFFPDIEHTFKHAFTHEVAYQSLLHHRRRGLHARIVEAIETLFVDRLDEQVDHLAHHASEAQVWEKAARYRRRAGERAGARSAHREAVHHFERALVALGHLPEDRERLEAAVDLRFALRTALLPLGDSRRIAECLREAEPLAVALGDQRRLGRLRAYQTNYFYMAGDQTRALELGHDALAIAERLGDQPLQTEIHYRLGQIYYTLGDYPRAVEVLERSVESVTGERVHERFGLPALPAVIARTWLVHALAERGEFSDAMRRADEAIQLAEAADHPYTLAFAYWGAGGVRLSRGDIDRATAILERGLEVCERWGITVWRPRFACALGLAYARGQRAKEGLRLLKDAFEHATAAGVAVDRALFAVALCEGYLHAGGLADAARLGGTAVELTVGSGQRGREAWGHWLLGEVARRRNPADLATAGRAYRTALAAAESLGMCPLQVYCHRGLSALYQRAGDVEAARPHAAAATALARAMDLRC
jgi:class 3 adenylate cyclase/tetratricopeptide (TPR) repeat protein